MKQHTLIAFAIIFCMGCFSDKNNNEYSPQVELLTAVSSEIVNILEEVRKAYEDENEFNNQVFILRTEKVKNNLEVIVSVYEQSDFEYCFGATLFPLFGFYQYNSYRVLVYGDDSQELFQKQGKKIDLDLLNCVKVKIIKSNNDIPYPPIAFEPVVWIYHGNAKKLIFTEQAQFNMIE